MDVLRFRAGGSVTIAVNRVSNIVMAMTAAKGGRMKKVDCVRNVGSCYEGHEDGAYK